MTGPEVPFPLSFDVKNLLNEPECRDCPFPLLSDGREVPFPLSIKSIPQSVGDLIGHPCRVIRPGDDITLDYRPDRVNIILDEQSTIKDISFG
jgi:hypothetical protein